jgi:probable phosphoglycerate mutase
MRQIVLVRHGETTWSLTGRHTGRTDLPLTPAGQRQAEALGRQLEGRRFARVLTSPLRRAIDTCALAGLGERAELRPELTEWDYGRYEGRTTTDIHRERPRWSLWAHGAPGGETAADVGTRVDRLLSDVAAIDGPVVVFAHGHLLRVLTARWLGLPPDQGRLFALATAAVSVLGFERQTPIVVHWNQTPPTDTPGARKQDKPGGWQPNPPPWRSTSAPAASRPASSTRPVSWWSNGSGSRRPTPALPTLW